MLNMFRSEDRRLSLSFSKRVLVHTKDGHSIYGVLRGNYADSVEVSGAIYVRDDGTRTSLDGHQIILHSNISWVQEMKDAEGF